jgi:hypothetical protein
MRTLRIAPFDGSYEVRPFGSSGTCGTVRGTAKGALAECVYAGGARMRCHTCGWS